MDSQKVTYGKSAVSGPIYSAPVGSTLPKSADEELDGAFIPLGYCSDDGLTNANELESEDIKAWGGDTVLTIQNGKTDKFTFKLIEALNVDVLKTVYGEENVTGSLEAGIVVKANGKPLPSRVYVVDMIMKNGVLKRIVIPNADISEMGEIDYSDSDAVGYDITLTASPDTDGNTHYEYIKG